MDKDTIAAISTGVALVVGAFITPFFNFLKDLWTGGKPTREEDEVVTKSQLECKLEVKHRDIMDEVGRKFASNETVSAMQSEFKEIKGKLDKIYDLLIERNNK